MSALVKVLSVLLVGLVLIGLGTAPLSQILNISGFGTLALILALPILPIAMVLIAMLVHINRKISAK